MDFEDFLRRLTACRACPRLVEYRSSFPPGYWAKPVPPWGSGPIMVVGLAPAAHGGNRTGRMFTGDRSSQNLFKALYEAGLASRPYSISRDDGVELYGVYITSAVKCAPPGNKPTAEEVKNCSRWLREEVEIVKPRVVVALGRVAWRAVSEILGVREEFRHGAVVEKDGVYLVGAYHPSPRNINTGRIAVEELAEVFKLAKKLAKEEIQHS